MKKVFLALAACICLYGCEEAELAMPFLVFDRAAYEEAQTSWDAQGITSYSFDITVYMNPPMDPYRITVTEGEITGLEVIGEPRWSKEKSEENKAWVEDFIRSDLGTVPLLFAWIEKSREDAIRSLATLHKGQSIRFIVQYNKQYGYPEYMTSSISGPAEAPPPEGDGFEYTITNFKPLP